MLHGDPFSSSATTVAPAHLEAFASLEAREIVSRTVALVKNQIMLAGIKLELDLHYIKHRTLLLDIIILLRTFGTVFGLRGQ